MSKKSVYLFGDGPIAGAIKKKLKGKVTFVTHWDTCDTAIWCRGKSIDVSIIGLIEYIRRYQARSYIIVTSEHGSIPVSNPDYLEYAAIKAGQKMIFKSLLEQGIKAVDISPAFVGDSGNHKLINIDKEYRAHRQRECIGDFPVSTTDVAEAAVFALNNLNKIAGTTIRVGAGWKASHT